jgi:cyanophycinase
MSTASPPRGQLVIVGGGELVRSILEKTLEVAGGTSARVLVVPHASEDLESGYRMVELWTELGAERVDVLDLTDTPAALELIKDADLIWLKGGQQERLMAVLQAAGLVDAIRDRFADGATIGGTSAGAAVMSRLMIAGGPRTAEDQALLRPRLGSGLGLWPEAVVDQHFLRRNRLPRLMSVVNDHPGLVGVGIDECAAVLVRGQHFEVMGESRVVVIDARHARKHHGVPTIAMLDPGTVYHLERGILDVPSRSR